MTIRFGQIEIDAKTQTIRNGAHMLDCKHSTNGSPPAKVRFTAFKYLLCANGNGIRYEKLFELVYGDCKDGGPDAGPRIFDTHFANWAAVIKRLHLQVKREKRGGVTYLRMVPVNVV